MHRGASQGTERVNVSDVHGIIGLLGEQIDKAGS